MNNSSPKAIIKISKAKRRLASLYDDDDDDSSNALVMCEYKENNDIKTEFIFDDDSNDSGFNEECKNHFFENLSLNTPSQAPEVSKSKRMKIVEEDHLFENDIKNLLEHEEQAHLFIGDKSKEYVLPTLQTSKHRDLASISSHTMSDLLTGKFVNEVERVIIIDARYPYEFDGGHIEGALNLYLKDQVFDYLFKEIKKVQDNSKRLLIVIHCEFSSERGPRLMRDIRERDRTLNKQCYPKLYYPELYLLEGGYKNFYQLYSDNCIPKSYKPMLHDDHRNDLKFFRKKSKSWDSDVRRIKISKVKFLDF